MTQGMKAVIMGIKKVKDLMLWSYQAGKHDIPEYLFLKEMEKKLK